MVEIENGLLYDLTLHKEGVTTFIYQDNRLHNTESIIISHDALSKVIKTLKKFQKEIKNETK